MTDDDINNERERLAKVSGEELSRYIYNSIDVRVDIKAQEKYEEKLKEKEENEMTENEGMNVYESLLIKAEKDVRNHIRVR